MLADLQAELKATKRQRIRDIMKHPEQEALLEETYDEMEGELQRKIEGITHQIDLLSDKRNTIIRVNRVAKTALDVFQDILDKEKLDRNDLELMIDHIKVYEDHLEVQLQADVDQLLRAVPVEDIVNFDWGIGDNLSCRIVQQATHQRDKVFDVHVVSNGEGFFHTYEDDAQTAADSTWRTATPPTTHNPLSASPSAPSPTSPHPETFPYCTAVAACVPRGASHTSPSPGRLPDFPKNAGPPPGVPSAPRMPPSARPVTPPSSAPAPSRPWPDCTRLPPLHSPGPTA